MSHMNYRYTKFKLNRSYDFTVDPKPTAPPPPPATRSINKRLTRKLYQHLMQAGTSGMNKHQLLQTATASVIENDVDISLAWLVGHGRARRELVKRPNGSEARWYGLHPAKR